MQNSLDVARFQRQKIFHLRLALFAFCLLTTALLLRFVPLFNELLSGKPPYMEVLANNVAGRMVASMPAPPPVIVLHDEEFNCKNVRPATLTDASLNYYVFYYSERSSLLCLVVYAEAAAASEHHGTITLTPESGKRYGRKLARPVELVPVGHAFAKLFDDALFWLDWHRASPGHPLGLLQLHQARNDSIEFSIEMPLDNVAELRRLVAARHNRINATLAGALALSLLLLIVAASRAGITFHRFQRYSRVYGHANFRDYLFQDLVVLDEQMHRAYYAQREELQAAVRAEDIRRRAEYDTRQELLRQLEASSDPQEQQRIRECLDSQTLSEMTALLRELAQAAQPEPPEVRLNLLLGSLRDFCSPEELDHCRQEALTILQDRGFRPAREFIVHKHSELRMRARKAEQETDQNERDGT